MSELALTIAGTAAIILGVRCFALWIARRTEGKRPPPASDDQLYGIAHGDWPKVPAVNDLSHFGTSTTRRRNDHAGR